jgi:hypothetical protein
MYTINEEKLLLLSAIATIQKEMFDNIPSETLNDNIPLEILQRYYNLIACLIKLNWQEIERRKY